MLKYQHDFLISSDPALGAIKVTPDGSTFSIRLEEKGLGVPYNAKNCTLQVIGAEFWNNNNNITTSNNQIYITSAGISKLLNIPPGLYSIDTLQSALIQTIRDTVDSTFINSLLNTVGTSTTCNITFTPNYALNKTIMTLTPAAGNTITVDYRAINAPNTISPIVGFTSVYSSTGPTVTIVTSENVPAFNQYNYYLIQSNIVNRGLRVNSNYLNIIAKIKIQSSPNTQNVYDPKTPSVIVTPELINDTRKEFQFSLLESNLNLVNTKGEYWSATLRITYHL